MGEVVAFRRREPGHVGGQWVRTKELAERYSVCENTIRRWVETGMPSTKIHRARLFEVAACDLWVRERSA